MLDVHPKSKIAFDVCQEICVVRYGSFYPYPDGLKHTVSTTSKSLARLSLPERERSYSRWFQPPVCSTYLSSPERTTCCLRISWSAPDSNNKNLTTKLFELTLTKLSASGMGLHTTILTPKRGSHENNRFKRQSQRRYQCNHDGTDKRIRIRNG